MALADSSDRQPILITTALQTMISTDHPFMNGRCFSLVRVMHVGEQHRCQPRYIAIATRYTQKVKRKMSDSFRLDSHT